MSQRTRDPDTSPAEAACAFVARNGDALALARARARQDRSRSPALLALLAELDVGSLRARERLLWLCSDAGLLRSDLARGLARALTREQGDDGAWRAAEMDEDEALRCTGRIAGCLARSPFARPETLDAAGDCLARSWDPDRVSNGRLADLHAYALFFANALHDASDEILQWCGRELERGFRTRTFSAVETLGVLVDCDAHCLPGARFAAGELLVALLTEQAPDGSFGRAAAAADRVESTLVGLHALERFQR